MQRLKNNLAFQLWAFYLLLVSPMLAALFIFDQVAGQSIQRDVTVGDTALARAVAQEAEFTIRNALNAVRELGQIPAVRSAEPGGMDAVFSLMTRARLDVSLIYRLDATGRMVYHYPTGPVSTVGRDFSFREYFRRAQLAQAPLLSEGRLSPTTNQVVASAVMPLWDEENRFLGVVAANIQMESLSQTLSQALAARLPEEGYQMLILDNTGHIVAHPQSEYLLMNGQEFAPEIASLPHSILPGNKILKDRQGKEYLYTYAPIVNVDWMVIVRRPTAAAFAEQTNLHRMTLLTLTLVALIGLLFWVLLAWRVLQPVEQLSQLGQKMSRNQAISQAEQNNILRLSQRPDQLGALIRILMQMQAATSARINEQTTLLETSQAVVSSLDVDTVLNRILEQVKRLMDVEKVVILALDQPSGVFRIRASLGFSRHYTEQINIAPDDPLSVTMRALRTNLPQQVSDTETDESYQTYRESARQEGYRSLLAVALQTQYHPPAALVIFHAYPHVFDENEARLLSSFANQAAMALENAALFARSESRRREQTRRMEALIQSLEDGLILGDLDGNILYVNRRASELADLLPSEMSGLSLERALARALARAEDPAEAQHAVQQALKTQRLRREMEIPLLINERTNYLRLHFFDVTNPRGAVIGQGVILRDITHDREIDRMKSGLIATVSHELRTPLAAIKGYASTLLAEDVQWDADSQNEFLRIISSEADRLGQLVNNLLDLSRIEAGSFNLQKIECDIETIIQRAAQSGHLQENNRLLLEIEPDLPPLLADPPRLETILRNLIENAVKYAGTEAEIFISVRRNSNRIIFRVQDDGPGIPPGEGHKIFDSFYQANAGFSRTAGGAGLGLAICQGFVRAHGGEIWVEPSERGACIAFSLPLEPVAV